MADFDSHVKQAADNLRFVYQLNHSGFTPPHIDWQITAAFYTAVHLANAHISKVSALNFRTHRDVEFALNPFGENISVCAWEPDAYEAYLKLAKLSRKARYICNPENLADTTAHFVKPKNQYQAFKYLDTIIRYFSRQHAIRLTQDLSENKVELRCQFTALDKLEWFDIRQPAPATSQS